MEYIIEFIKPELLVLVPVLYIMGTFLKKAQAFADNYIPLALTVAGIILAALWVVGTVPINTAKEIVLAVFTALVQGIICAGLSVYGDQMAKQAGKTK
jgi:hypothetical protein